MLVLAAGLLALVALAALLVGWVWVQSRGDWQAFALWSYWAGTPVLCGLSLRRVRSLTVPKSPRDVALKGLTLLLLALWGALSGLVLIWPVLR